MVLGALLIIWLLPWSLLTGAAIVSGAHPVVSPLDFINPVRLVSVYRADGNAVVWWHLVGAAAPAHAWLFVGFIVVALLAIVLLVGAAACWPGPAASRASGRRDCWCQDGCTAPLAGRPGVTCARSRSAAPAPARWCWDGAAPTSSPRSPRPRCW